MGSGQGASTLLSLWFAARSPKVTHRLLFQGVSHYRNQTDFRTVVCIPLLVALFWKAYNTPKVAMAEFCIASVSSTKGVCLRSCHLKDVPARTTCCLQGTATSIPGLT